MSRRCAVHRDVRRDAPSPSSDGGHVRWMVERARWQSPLQGRDRPSLRTRSPTTSGSWCALIAHGPEATTAGSHGSRSRRPFAVSPHPHLSTSWCPGARNPRAMPGVKVHSSERLSERDIHPVRLPRRTRIQRSIIDAADMGRHTTDRPKRILAASVQQKPRAPEALQLAIAPRLTLPAPARPDRRVPCRDVAGGSLSEYEMLFLRLCRGNRASHAHPAGTEARFVRSAAVPGRRVRRVRPRRGDRRTAAHGCASAGATTSIGTTRLSLMTASRTVLRFAGFALRHQSDHGCIVASTLLRYVMSVDRRPAPRGIHLQGVSIDGSPTPSLPPAARPE